MIIKRRRFKQSKSLEERLADEAMRLRAQADLLRPGSRREGLLKKAHQCETGSHISEWLRSSELQPPK